MSIIYIQYIYMFVVEIVCILSLCIKACSRHISFSLSSRLWWLTRSVGTERDFAEQAG